MTRKPPQPGQLSPDMLRTLKAGAKWGAIIGAAIGFIIVTGVSIKFKVPIPPLAASEVGILLGVSLGLPIAIICRTRPGRVTMASLGIGTLLGIPAAFWPTGHFHLLTWGGVAFLTTFLGYQSGQVHRTASTESWRLHR